MCLLSGLPRRVLPIAERELKCEKRGGLCSLVKPALGHAAGPCSRYLEFQPQRLRRNSTSGTIARHTAAKSRMNAEPQTCLSLKAMETTKSLRLMSSMKRVVAAMRPSRNVGVRLVDYAHLRQCTSAIALSSDAPILMRRIDPHACTPC